MNRKLLPMLFVLLILSAALPAFAQDAKEPACNAYSSGDQTARVAYYMGEGQAFVNSTLYNRSVESFTCAVQLDAGYVDGYLNRGLSYVALRDYNNAVKDFSKVIELKADYLPAYNNRGIVYTAQGDYDKALEDFSKVLSLKADSVTGYNNRGVVYAAQKKYDEAIADFKKAIEINKDYAQPYALLGIVYSAQALDNYNRYLELADNQADRRIQGVANSLASRFSYELRFDDGTWLLTADLGASAPPATQ